MLLYTGTTCGGGLGLPVGIFYVDKSGRRAAGRSIISDGLLDRAAKGRKCGPEVCRQRDILPKEQYASDQ